MEIQVVKTLRGKANVDLVCVPRLTIRKGQVVTARLLYSKEWPAGGFRTDINNGLCFTNADAFYDCIDPLNGCEDAQ